MFSLSSTGQPFVWTVVCDECLKLIKELTSRLSGGIKGENGCAKLCPDASFGSEATANVPVPSQLTQSSNKGKNRNTTYVP